MVFLPLPPAPLVTAECSEGRAGFDMSVMCIWSSPLEKLYNYRFPGILSSWLSGQERPAEEEVWFDA